MSTPPSGDRAHGAAPPLLEVLGQADAGELAPFLSFIADSLIAILGVLRAATSAP